VSKAELERKISLPPGLGNPALRVGPQAGAVFGDGEVEAGVRVGNLLGVAVEQGKVEAVLALEATGGGELSIGIVHADHARPSPSQPGRDVRRPASQLDDVLRRQVRRQQAHL
jgi:hypothetical protein